MTQIDEYHAYYTFKFLTRKPVAAFKDTPQFLHMLRAEEEGLVDIQITIDDDSIQQFVGALVQCVKSVDSSEIAVECVSFIEDEPCVSSVDVNMDAREGRGDGRVEGPGSMTIWVGG